MHQCDFDPSGFRWIDCNDNENSVVSLVRFARDRRDAIVMAFNFTPVPRLGYRIGVPYPGRYVEILNSDSAIYGGSNTFDTSTSVVVVDFYRRLVLGTNDRIDDRSAAGVDARQLRVSRIATAAFGLLGTYLATNVARIGGLLEKGSK